MTEETTKSENEDVLKIGSSSTLSTGSYKQCSPSPPHPPERVRKTPFQTKKCKPNMPFEEAFPERRRASLREKGEKSKKAYKENERRGSLKAFAFAVLDRKGSLGEEREVQKQKHNKNIPSIDRVVSLSSNGLDNQNLPPPSPFRKKKLLRTASSSVFNSDNDLYAKKSSQSNNRSRGGSLRIVKKDSAELTPPVHAVVSALTDDLKARLMMNEPVTSSPKAQRRTRRRTSKASEVAKCSIAARASSDSGFETIEMPSVMPSSSSAMSLSIRHIDLEADLDIVQKIGEGWFSRVYLAENRRTREEIVIKAINSAKVSPDEFLTEFKHTLMLTSHKNVLHVFDDVFQSNGYYMFSTEYAPLGDLTSNIGDCGIGEMCTKRVARQIGSALEWVHSKNLCHLDVKLDNILVFKSDFSLVKLCDFGSVRGQGDIIIKKNELLPYCPPEIVVKHANEYYQVDRVQDVFQFGIVTFFCLFGILPWQRADITDPNYSEFYSWRSKKTSKPPKNFKPMTNRGQKLFRRLMDVDPSKRFSLKEMSKFLEDKWLKKNSKGILSSDMKKISDGVSQLTMGSFQSVHSNAVEKNRILYTLLQHGVETTVDYSQKNSRIINWIQHGQANSVEDPNGEEIKVNNEQEKSNYST